MSLEEFNKSSRPALCRRLAAELSGVLASRRAASGVVAHPASPAAVGLHVPYWVLTESGRGLARKNHV
jgi:hypothetical protein